MSRVADRHRRIPPLPRVGGTDAQNVDIGEATSSDRGTILPLILIVVLLSLGALLRSIAAPAILVVTVVATYLAALGAGWLASSGLFGFERLDSGIPLLAFLFLVALGVDYNIFLVTRAAEEARGHGPQEGMLRALGREEVEATLHDRQGEIEVICEFCATRYIFDRVDAERLLTQVETPPSPSTLQ